MGASMDKLQQLMSRCKCGVHLQVNGHRDVYQSVAERLDQYEALAGGLELADEVRQKMIEKDTIIDLQFYPDTPIGSYSIYHYDLDAALDQALACFQ
jgi:hypothetical protein